MTDNQNLADWITTAEASRLTGYHVVHIRRLIKDSSIEGVKMGRDWIVNKAGILEYCEKMKLLGTSKHDPWRNKD
jgi:excisionase family DNA binding protein